MDITEESDPRDRLRQNQKSEDVDPERRRFLTAATSVIGGVGAACVALPFLTSWMPSARARAQGAPVEVDISKLEPGQKITVAWRGKPIFIVYRTEEALQRLSTLISMLRDPDSLGSLQPQYASGPYRAVKERILVVEGICTHLGCVPLYKPELGALDADWPGGFFCPCHGSKYDLSGRVYKGVPAPLNLPIPPHTYLSDTLLLLGEGPPQGTV